MGKIKKTLNPDKSLLNYFFGFKHHAKITDFPKDVESSVIHSFCGTTKTCLFKYTENFTAKTENFQIKIQIFFLISAQNIDCGYLLEPPHRGGSNEYPQSMFLSRNKKNYVYPCKSQFYYIIVGFKGGQN